MAAILANIAKCTFQTIRSITKSFISRPAIWVSRISIRNTRASAFKFAGISGTRKARASPPLAARKSSFTQRVSAGTRKKRRSSGPHNLTRGERFSAPTPSPTEPTSPLSIASATRAIRKTETPASNSGEILSSLIRSAKSPPKQAAKRRKFSSSNAIRRKARRHAATGRSSATAASTPITPFSIAGSANDVAVVGDTFFPWLSHARRVGAARRHLAWVAARTYGLARKIYADSLGLRGNRATPCSRGTRFPLRRKSRRRISRALNPEKITRERGQRGLFPRAHRSRLDARLRSNLREERSRQRRIQQFRFHWLGQIRESQERRANRLTREQIAKKRIVSAASQRPSRHSRRRLHRRQRRGHTPHHRRMSAEQNSGTQSWFYESALRAGLPQSVRCITRHLAEKWHRW